MIDYKEKVKSDNMWIAKEQLNNIPIVIQKEYEYLRECIFNDDICGGLFRLKDIYETSVKIPSIMAIIAISEYMEQNSTFVRRTSEQLKEELEEFRLGSNTTEETDAYKKYNIILYRLLREPLSIGAWGELMELMVENSELFELDANLVKILLKSIQLLKVRPKKVYGQSGRYDDVGSWRNKTIGHGTLSINTEDYWEQVYDLVQGLYIYFTDDINGEKLNILYQDIAIIQNAENDYRLLLGEKEYQISEYLKGFEGEPYFFDSYYSRQQCVEVTNYLKAPRRLKGITFFQKQYEMICANKKNGTKKTRRKISNSSDREIFACLNNAPSYEKPVYVIEKIKHFINNCDKGLLYIQMERGMGKSTLAHGLDGRYQTGILQKDLNAVVRVYHISDTMLRGENRKKDFYTALNANLVSYEGGQLEVDTDEYIIAGQDIRHQIECNDEGAQMAFARCLELFRNRYDDEICDNQNGQTKLVYIIDGIDELNSDTKDTLYAIPSDELLKSIGDDVVSNVYIVLLSRKSDEAGLPDVAKECIALSEKKAGQICKISSTDENYVNLLKKYIKKNYKGITDIDAEDIIKRAQYKFLYIHPYIALGEIIIKDKERINAYSVAKKYVEELQNMYCGVSANSLALILSAIAVFHSISLREICRSVLFTEVSYDVVGVLNDILPLLMVKRTDGEDVYEYSNEEFEQYILNEQKNSVCEVICRFRLYVRSWVKEADSKQDNYGKEWSKVVSRVLYIDNLAGTIKFLEVDEEYIQTLLMIMRKNPNTIYSESVSELLQINIIGLLEQLKYVPLKVLTISDLSLAGLEFEKKNGKSLKRTRLSEYTNRMIEHCVKEQKVDDVWFQFLTYTRYDPTECEEENVQAQKIKAIRGMFAKWKTPAQLVEYFYHKIRDDYEDNPEGFATYAVYLEIMTDYVSEYAVKERLYEGLLYAYMKLVNGSSRKLRIIISDNRRSVILRNVEDAENYKDLENYQFIHKIIEGLSFDCIVDKALADYETLAKNPMKYTSGEFASKYYKTVLNTDKLTDEQQERYKKTTISLGQLLLKKIEEFNDAGESECVTCWLIDVPFAGEFMEYFNVKRDEILKWLDLYSQYVKEYVRRNEWGQVDKLSSNYSRLLRFYDENIRKTPSGIYRVFGDEVIDPNQRLTEWEKIYAINCSTMSYLGYDKKITDNPIIANNYTNKLLQELYSDRKLEQYYALNQQIDKGYTSIQFKNKYILENKYQDKRLIRNYYRWLAVRYYRSLEGNDMLQSDILKNRIKNEYLEILERILFVLEDAEGLVNTSNMFGYVTTIVLEILSLSKMMPDEVISEEATRKVFMDRFQVIQNKYAGHEQIIKYINRIIDYLNGTTQWCNSEKPFIADTTDWTIFG